MRILERFRTATRFPWVKIPVETFTPPYMTRRRRVFLFILLLKSAADIAFGILLCGNGALIIKLFTAADA